MCPVAQPTSLGTKQPTPDVMRRRVRGRWRADRRIRERAAELRRQQTVPEWALWQILRNRQLDGFRFRRQCAVGKYIVDFYCPAAHFVIELDGETHDDSRAAYDARRSAWLKQQKYLRVLRVANDDVRDNLDGVYDLILRELRRGPPPDLPRSRRRSRGRNLVT